MATLQQIAALPDEEAARLTRSPDFKAAPNSFPETHEEWLQRQRANPTVPLAKWVPKPRPADRHLLMRAYAYSGQLAIADRPFINLYARNIRGGAHRSDLSRLLPYYTVSTEDRVHVGPAVALLEGEELAMYLAIRLLFHLGAALNQNKKAGQLRRYLLPEPRRLDRQGDTLVPLDPPGEIQWLDEVTPEFKKSSGLGLLADLELGLPISALHNWKSYPSNSVLTPVESWRHALGDAAIQDAAYVTYRACKFSFEKEAKKDQTWYNMQHPGAVQHNARALIDGISDTLHAYLARDLIHLPQPGQAYLEYVNRVLLNYRYYGVVGLRASDLLEGDAVFSRVGGAVLPAVSRHSLPIVGTVKDMIDTYLVKIPSDEVILQRLIRL